jgi:hypothetical protein
MKRKDKPKEKPEKKGKYCPYCGEREKTSEKQETDFPDPAGMQQWMFEKSWNSFDY